MRKPTVSEGDTSMSPAKALELVERYSRLHLAIKACKQRIGEQLEKCQGQNGWRKETETYRFEDADWTAPTERATTDETHLPLWYRPEVVEYDHGSPYEPPEVRNVYREIGAKEQAECPHCYAAHLVIQERKAMRRQLSAVKGAMTRSTK